MPSKPITMTHRLEYWNGREYVRTYAYSDGSREMHNQCIWGLIRDPAGLQDPDRKAYRIVRKESDRPLKPRVPRLTTSTRVTQSDSISMQAQAQAAAEHYQRLRETSELGLLPIHVYPVKPSGRGMAADFRLELARILTKQVPMTHGTFWGKSANETRSILENRLGLAGYQFVEVDPDDYV